jgi:hypothetical protein
VGGGVLITIVLILLVKLKPWKQYPSIPVGAVETSPDPFPIYQVNYL